MPRCTHHTVFSLKICQQYFLCIADTSSGFTFMFTWIRFLSYNLKEKTVCRREGPVPVFETVSKRVKNRPLWDCILVYLSFLLHVWRQKIAISVQTAVRNASQAQCASFWMCSVFFYSFFLGGVLTNRPNNTEASLLSAWKTYCGIAGSLSVYRMNNSEKDTQFTKSERHWSQGSRVCEWCLLRRND